MYIGRICKLVLDRGFGFIASPDLDKDAFVHKRDIEGGLAWDESLLERRVSFNIREMPRGIHAVYVRPA